MHQRRDDARARRADWMPECTGSAEHVDARGIELDPVSAAYRDHMLGLPAMRDWTEASKAEPWVERHDEIE